MSRCGETDCGGEASNTLYIHPAIPAQYESVAGDMYENLEYKSFVTDLADEKGGGIQLHGVPMEPKRLSMIGSSNILGACAL